MTTKNLSTNETIMYRGRWKGSIYWALPVTVIQDDSSKVVLYWPAGTPCKRPAKRATIPELLNPPYPALSDSFWTDTDILMLCEIGKPYSINRMTSTKNGELLCWYVNIQAPIQRIDIGFETEDLLLDVVFEPDLSSWKLKDEDELIEAVNLGIFDQQEEEEIRLAAQESISNIMSDKSPINKKWMYWTPPTSWDIPVMPDYWYA